MHTPDRSSARLTTLVAPPLTVPESTPLVSIIIPCYKQAHLLPEAIDSALAQTYANYEVIVIDDGSPDKTYEVATSYSSVRCIRQENRGLAEARNTGLRASRGEFLVFLDADDHLTPAALSLGLQCFAARPEAQMVFGRYVVMSAEGRPNAQPTRLYEGDDYYRDLLVVNYIGAVGAVMYRRAVFAEVGGFRQHVAPAADYDLYLRIARRFPLAHYDAVTTRYRIYEGSMSQDFAIMLQCTIRALKSQHSLLVNQPDYLTYYHKGLAFWRSYYGELLYLDVMTRRDRYKKWRRTLRDLSYLLRYYPQVITIHGKSRLQKLAARLGRTDYRQDVPGNE
jgi:glycosyltransferase involved in cell wall biosynthesis